MREDEELKALIEMRDEDIDTSDIPERTDWSNAVRGKFYRPVKEPITIRLDADVIAWLKSGGPGYQTRVNVLLRACMVGKGLQNKERPATTKTCNIRFPTLERQGHLSKSLRLAESIQTRGSLFAPAA